MQDVLDFLEARQSESELQSADSAFCIPWSWNLQSHFLIELEPLKSWGRIVTSTELFLGRDRRAWSLSQLSCVWLELGTSVRRTFEKSFDKYWMNGFLYLPDQVRSFPLSCEMKGKMLESCAVSVWGWQGRSGLLEDKEGGNPCRSTSLLFFLLSHLTSASFPCPIPITASLSPYSKITGFPRFPPSSLSSPLLPCAHGLFFGISLEFQ